MNTNYDRENFPLAVGDQIVVDDETWTFVDLPTDGPLFRNEDEPNAEFEMIQLEFDEFEDIYAEADTE